MTWDHSLSRHERGYGYEWTKRRVIALRRDRYLCQPCERMGRTTPATEVDHIDPKAKDGSDDLDNLQSICTPCHKAKTKAESHGNRRPTIGADGWPVEDAVKRWGYSIPDNVQPSKIPVILISGPPACGKSTWVEANSRNGDLIVDFDAYRQKVGGKKWDTNPKVWARAFALRDADIRSLKNRTEGRCLLIVTAPTSAERQTWCDALGAVTVKVIRTPADVCIARIKSDPRRQDAADSQIEAVNNWWRYN